MCSLNWDIAPLNSSDSSFQVILDGVVGSGIYGDIAVDDLSLLGENTCDSIKGNG